MSKPGNRQTFERQMNIWSIADLHLSFGVPDKSMDCFGPQWQNHPAKVEAAWRSLIQQDDIVLLAGDISWGKKIAEALPDLEWIDSLPGQKLLIRGNHDYWWDSISKVKKAAPPSLRFIQNDAIEIDGISFGGTRLFDSPEYTFNDYIIFQENPRASPKEKKEDTEAIFTRELLRLEMSLKALNQESRYRIVMTHYPPIGADLAESRASRLFDKYRVDEVIFGHLHSVREGSLPFGVRNKTRYTLTSADYIHFTPVRIL
ncbi:MAG: hypothetical protein K0S07_1359 [Chlamydiales bacterium]|jgi:predicted phosphohydrolase|nr:hypothetical protein [Chlamydiales bacterium]